MNIPVRSMDIFANKVFGVFVNLALLARVALRTASVLALDTNLVGMVGQETVLNLKLSII